MTWSEEKAKLLLAHRLKRRRIRLNRGLASLGILLVGALAYFVAPEFASHYKERELQLSNELELSNLVQLKYFEKRLESYEIIDSMYWATLASYKWGVFNAGRLNDSTPVDDIKSRLDDDVFRLVTTLKRHQYYLNEDYHRHVNMQCILFLAVGKLALERWPAFLDFFEWLSSNLTYLLKTDLPRFQMDTISPPKRQVFLLPLARRQGENRVAAAHRYFKETFDEWTQFIDSLDAAGASYQ